MQHDLLDRFQFELSALPVIGTLIDKHYTNRCHQERLLCFISLFLQYIARIQVISFPLKTSGSLKFYLSELKPWLCLDFQTIVNVKPYFFIFFCTEEYILHTEGSKPSMKNQGK